jgi:hypothetical protein
MACNFLPCDRDQAFLLLPDLRGWLPASHLAWFVVEVVDQFDLGPFLGVYRDRPFGTANWLRTAARSTRWRAPAAGRGGSGRWRARAPRRASRPTNPALGSRSPGCATP